MKFEKKLSEALERNYPLPESGGGDGGEGCGGGGQQLTLESSRVESQILLFSFHKSCLSNLQNGEVIPTSLSCWKGKEII